MANTYEAIATNTLGSNATDITFSSISSSYTDLVLVINVNGVSSAGGTLHCQVNSDTGNNYSFTFLGGNGSTASSSRLSSTDRMLLTDYVVGLSTTTPTMVIAQFQNYSNTTTYKTMLSRGSGASTEVDAGVSLWRSTAAINAIKIYMSGGKSMLTGTTASLYGIKSA